MSTVGLVEGDPTRAALVAQGVAAGGGAPGAMVEAHGLARDFPYGDDVVHALRGVELVVARAELIAVRGRSGSGKTTLLNLLGGLDRPTAGSVVVDGTDLV